VAKSQAFYHAVAVLSRWAEIRPWEGATRWRLGLLPAFRSLPLRAGV